MDKKTIEARYNQRLVNAGKVYHNEVLAINIDATSRKTTSWNEYQSLRKRAKAWRRSELDRLQGKMVQEPTEVLA